MWLLSSFMILATKWKPPHLLTITTVTLHKKEHVVEFIKYKQHYANLRKVYLFFDFQRQSLIKENLIPKFSSVALWKYVFICILPLLALFMAFFAVAFTEDSLGLIILSIMFMLNPIVAIPLSSFMTSILEGIQNCIREFAMYPPLKANLNWPYSLTLPWFVWYKYTSPINGPLSEIQRLKLVSMELNHIVVNSWLILQIRVPSKKICNGNIYSKTFCFKTDQMWLRIFFF